MLPWRARARVSLSMLRLKESGALHSGHKGLSDLSFTSFYFFKRYEARAFLFSRSKSLNIQLNRPLFRIQ